MGRIAEQGSLEKAIHSRTEQVIEHMLKIENPYNAEDWEKSNYKRQVGLIAKWIKDMVRNAEEALILIESWRMRYGHNNDKS